MSCAEISGIRRRADPCMLLEPWPVKPDFRGDMLEDELGG